MYGFLFGAFFYSILSLAVRRFDYIQGNPQAAVFSQRDILTDLLMVPQMKTELFFSLFPTKGQRDRGAAQRQLGITLVHIGAGRSGFKENFDSLASLDLGIGGEL